MRHPKGTVIPVAGHSGYRGQITINSRTYYRYFYENKRESPMPGTAECGQLRVFPS